MGPVNGYDHSLSWAVELIRTDVRRLTDLQIATIEQGRRVENMQRDIMSMLKHMPDRIQASRTVPTMPATAQNRTTMDRLSIGDWLKVALGATVLVLVVAGKLTWTDALPLLRNLIGIQ